MNMHPQLLATLLLLALAPPCHLSPPLLDVALPASSPNGKFGVSAARWGKVGWRFSGSCRALVLRGGGDVAMSDGESEANGTEEWPKEHIVHIAPKGSAFVSFSKLVSSRRCVYQHRQLNQCDDPCGAGASRLRAVRTHLFVFRVKLVLD